MASPDLPVIIDLLERRLSRDQQANNLLDAENYQALFPGFEDHVAKHYERFTKAASLAGCASEDQELSEFLRRYESDRDAAAIRSLGDYLSMFPGQERAVANKFAELQGVDESSVAPRLSAGDVLQHYRLERELGAGGQGVVWLAQDTRIGRMVAIKVLGRGRRDLADALARFHREAAVTARLRHPGICAVHDTGLVRGCAFLVLEYVEGQTLARHLSRAARGEDSWFRSDDGTELPLPRILSFVEQIARALHTAHASGIVHRDVKPQNIMVNPRGRPVVLDFGLASRRGDGLTVLTQTGDRLGTPAYMAPEQILGEAASIDVRTDVYALGVVLYECVTRRRPFRAANRAALYDKVLTGRFEPSSRIRRSVPADLDVVIQTAMAVSPELRYRSAAAFAEDLARLRSGRPILARTPSLAQRTWRLCGRNPRVASLLVVLLLAIVANVALLAVTHRQAAVGAEAVVAEQTAERELLRRHRAVTRARHLGYVHPRRQAFQRPLPSPATVRGLRIFAGSRTGEPAAVTARLFAPKSGAKLGLPLTTGTGLAPVTAGWCEVMFDPPLQLSAFVATFTIEPRHSVYCLFPFRRERLTSLLIQPGNSLEPLEPMPVSMEWILGPAIDWVDLGGGTAGSGAGGVLLATAAVEDALVERTLADRMSYEAEIVADRDMSVAGVDLLTSTDAHVWTPLSLQLLRADPSGRPGSPVAEGTVLVGASRRFYRLSFGAPVRLRQGERFFLKFRGTGIQAPFRRASGQLVVMRERYLQKPAGQPYEAALALRLRGDTGGVPVVSHRVKGSGWRTALTGAPRRAATLLWIGNQPVGEFGAGSVLPTNGIFVPLRTAANGTASVVGSWNLGEPSLHGRAWCTQWFIRDESPSGITRSNLHRLSHQGAGRR